MAATRVRRAVDFLNANAVPLPREKLHRWFRIPCQFLLLFVSRSPGHGNGILVANVVGYLPAARSSEAASSVDSPIFIRSVKATLEAVFGQGSTRCFRDMPLDLHPDMVRQMLHVFLKKKNIVRRVVSVADRRILFVLNLW